MKNKLKIGVISIVIIAVCAGIGLYATSQFSMYPTVKYQVGTVMENKGANLEIKGDEKNSGYYEDIAKAWAKANEITDKEVTLTLNEDWIAKDGSFGTGVGFGESGSLKPVDRATQYSSFVVNLNNHVIARNLVEPRDNGEVIALQGIGYFTFKDGTIKGGYTKTSGGGILINNDKAMIKLSDLNIEENYAIGNGGGIYTDACDAKVFLTNVTIAKNHCTKGFGGGLYINSTTNVNRENTNIYAQINLKGKITINENAGINGRNNLTLSNIEGKAKIDWVGDITNDSNILAGFTDDDNQGQIASIENEDLLNCFKSDRDISAVILENIGKEKYIVLKHSKK